MHEIMEGGRRKGWLLAGLMDPSSGPTAAREDRVQSLGQAELIFVMQNLPIE